MKKANKEAQPILIEGRKAWHIGKTPDGKEVFELEKGYCHLKGGKAEFGEMIDGEGNFVKLKKTEKVKEEGKKADG